ncbi:uroporphyrinogen-III C-methyltransferase [Flexithrix dorotheae]|uniref:uroporphyrinogen-III C-methyltransferase n=1 Tax=Flexithrix dorotheae TaxID=70993 RepID=UPI00035D9E9F|nr:uroporphyrinogen-III C-methyltransferase [Flexithrix dorotheae]
MIKKLTLVGAGPGDPDLISVKGVKALQNARVVLYDALVHTDLLDYAPENSTKIFVGKRSGAHSYKQEKINEIIVSQALTKGSVVRLKGGDPFIFGRGHEEKEYAESFGIEVEVIPGISSATSLSGLQSIPLTRREITHSFWVTTATGSENELTGDIKVAAGTNATLVVLMGMKKLPQISKLFKVLGKAETPVLIIQNGSLPGEQIVVGTMENIVEKVEERKIGTPAIIVIGEVVKLHPEFVMEYVSNNYYYEG